MANFELTPKEAADLWADACETLEKAGYTVIGSAAKEGQDVLICLPKTANAKDGAEVLLYAAIDLLTEWREWREGRET